MLRVELFKSFPPEQDHDEDLRKTEFKVSLREQTLSHVPIKRHLRAFAKWKQVFAGLSNQPVNKQKCGADLSERLKRW